MYTSTPPDIIESHDLTPLLSGLGNFIFSGIFVLALFGTVGQIWLNKPNKAYNAINIENVEEYM